MRVLAHVHTFNDADIIDQTIEALLQQTRPVADILLVDNASTDDTLNCPSLKHTVILRHRQNLGTSGAVYSGFRFALEQDYDWIWILDADSIVLPDALEKLLDLYSSWPETFQAEIGFLACMARNKADNLPWYGSVFTPQGINVVGPLPEPRFFRCHSYIWSGSLYRLAAVRKIGLPNANYVLDCGEDEYGYRVTRAGYKAFVHQDAILLHNIRGCPSMIPANCKLGLTTLTFYEFPPIRCYYTCRNTLYFVLYDFAKGRFGLLRGILWRVRRARGKPGLAPRGKTGLARGVVWRVFLLTMNFLLRPSNHGKQIAACFRGIWHGVTGNIAARY
jgi:GT2 family glycosyltransferase